MSARNSAHSADERSVPKLTGCAQGRATTVPTRDEMIATSAAQYLHPDLPPPASQMDVKKSPLAMLVQTCSAIGKDMAVKPIAPALGRITSSIDADGYRKVKVSEARHHHAAGGNRPAAPKVATPTPTTAVPVEPAKAKRESHSAVKERRHSGEGKHSLSPFQRRSSPRQEDANTATWPAASADGSLLAAQRSFAAYQALYPHLFPHLSHLYQVELAAHLRHQAEKAAAAGLYLKAAAAACRDPMCTSCQLARLHSAAAPLHPSFVQCGGSGGATDKLVSASGPVPLLPSLSPALLASLYPFPAPLAASGLPHVCHWVDGTEYCGKRFASTDDLLQHIKSHATESPTASPPPPLFAPYQGLQQSREEASMMTSSALGLQRSHNILSALRHHPYGGGKPYHYGGQSTPAIGSVAGVAAAQGSPSFLSMYPGIYGAALGAATAP